MIIYSVKDITSVSLSYADTFYLDNVIFHGLA